MDSQLEKELVSAIAALPAGYRLIETGHVEAGDMIWSFSQAKWSQTEEPKPFVKGQKRPGVYQHTDIGKNISVFVAVARKSLPDEDANTQL